LRIVTIDAGRPPVQVRIRVDDNNHFVDLIVSSAAHNPIHKTRGSSRIVFVRTVHEVDPVSQSLCRAVSKRLRRVVADGETIRVGSEPWRPLREPSTPGRPFPLTGACATRGAIPRASSSSTKRPHPPSCAYLTDFLGCPNPTSSIQWSSSLESAITQGLSSSFAL
jgi:hypothetical protein